MSETRADNDRCDKRQENHAACSNRPDHFVWRSELVVVCTLDILDAVKKEEYGDDEDPPHHHGGLQAVGIDVGVEGGIQLDARYTAATAMIHVSTPKAAWM
jgi:hypothetical protein